MRGIVDQRQARAWLSGPRYGRFYAAAGEDHAAAMRLYEWHAVLGMASFGLIHHFEVLVRNAIDRTLGEEQPQAPISSTWLTDFDVLRPNGIRQVIKAINLLVWRHQLHQAFPHATTTRKALSVRMRRIQRFRNRVAHHDSLLDKDIPALFGDMLEIAGWIDPQARAWLEAQTGAVEIARQVARFRDPVGAPV